MSETSTLSAGLPTRYLGDATGICPGTFLTNPRGSRDQLYLARVASPTPYEVSSLTFSFSRLGFQFRRPLRCPALDFSRRHKRQC